MPQEMHDCRGHNISGHVSDWSDVQLPGKLSLAISVSDLEVEDAILAMASKIGLGRLHSKTREEIQGLIIKSKLEKAA